MVRIHKIWHSESVKSDNRKSQKTDFTTITDQQIKEIEDKLNKRPRKRFNYENPIFVMNQLLFNQKLHL